MSEARRIGENDAHLSLFLPHKDKADLQQVARDARTSASAIVRKLIVDFLKDKTTIDKT